MPRPVEIQEYRDCLPPAWRDRADVPAKSEFRRWRGVDLHIARHRNPQAPIRLLLVHGAGGHSGALWPIAALAVDLGYELIAPDLPGYGQTRVGNPAAIRYPQWVDCLADVIRDEKANDSRPLVVLGASMGGLLAYSACARSGGVAHLLVTCLLDPSNPACWPALSRWGGALSVGLLRPLLKPLARPGFAGIGNLRLPIRWIAPMHKIANLPKLSSLCADDAHGGGSVIPLGFLASYLHAPALPPPEAFCETPVTMVHPTEDHWTPADMSLPFLQRIAAPTRHVPLVGCGHFPVEEPGLSTLVECLRELAVELK